MTSMHADHITVEGTRIDQANATLEVEDNGDSYSMTLRSVSGRVIAAASGFRPGAGQDFGAEHAAAHTAATFGAFLAHALEDEEARTGWDVIAEDADEWTDALHLMGEGEDG